MSCLDTHESFECEDNRTGLGLDMDGEIEITISRDLPGPSQKRGHNANEYYNLHPEKYIKRSSDGNLRKRAGKSDVNLAEDGDYLISISDRYILETKDFRDDMETTQSDQQDFTSPVVNSIHERMMVDENKDDLTLCAIKVGNKEESTLQVSISNIKSIAVPPVNISSKIEGDNTGTNPDSADHSYPRYEYASDPDNSNPVRTTWVTSTADKVQMRNNGHTWKTGKWTQDEISLLKSNIDKYCKEHNVDDASHIIFNASKETRPNFYPTISVGLNRPLFAVYRRVKRMYDSQNYRGKYTEDEVKRLKMLYKEHGRDWAAIGQLMGRSSDSVKDRCRLFLDNGHTLGKWSEAEEVNLARAVYTTTDTTEGTSVTTSICWLTVAEMVGTRTEKQCRAKWLNYLNWKMCNGENWTKTEDLVLLQRIASLRVEGEDEINWHNLSQGWKCSRSPQWLRVKWWYLKQLYLNVNPDVSKITLVQLLNELSKIIIKQINSWNRTDEIQKTITDTSRSASNVDANKAINKKLKSNNINQEEMKPAQQVSYLYVDNQISDDHSNIVYTTEHNSDIQGRIVFDKDSNGNYVVTQETSSDVYIDSTVQNIEQPQIGDEYLAKEQQNDITTTNVDHDDANTTLQLTPTSTPLVYLVQNSDTENPLMLVLSDDVNNVDFTPEMFSYINHVPRGDIATSTHCDVTNDIIGEHNSVVSSQNDITSSRHGDVITTSDVLVYQETSNDDETKNPILGSAMHEVGNVGDENDVENCFIQSSSPLQGTLLEGTDLASSSLRIDVPP